nr:hypothetical protein [Mycoplasmopsis bovis]
MVKTILSGGERTEYNLKRLICLKPIEEKKKEKDEVAKKEE